MSLFETLLIAAGSGLVTGLVTWGGLRVELRYLRRDVDAAHRRLDMCGAPGSWAYKRG